MTGTPPRGERPSPDSAERAGHHWHYGWVILLVGTLVVFGCLGLARFGYTVVLPSMQQGLDLDNTSAGFLASINLLGYALLSLLGGALASRFGPRAVIAAGLLLAAGAMLLTALAQGVVSAALYRFVTGVGSGLSNVPVMALTVAWFASRRRGLASGIVATGSSFGLIAVGSLVPRFLAGEGSDGWRTVWLAYGVVTLVLGLLAYLLLRNHPSEKGLRPLGEASREQPAAPERAADPKDTSPSNHVKAGAGAGLQWSRVYRSWPVYHLALVYTAFGFAYIIYLTFFSKYLTTEAGYTPNEAGDLLMLLGWISLSCGVTWGTVSDLIGRRAGLIIVYLIQATAFSLFGLWQSPSGYMLSTVLFGLTAWSIPAIMAAACGDVLGPRLAPAALGFITLFFAVGQAFGPTVAGAIADASGSFAPAFVLACGVSLCGAAGAALLRPASTQEARRVLSEAETPAEA